MENKSGIQTDRETLDTSNFMGGEGVDAKGSEGVGNETSTESTETSRDGWTSIFPKEDREKFAEQLKGFAKPKDLLAEYGRLMEREKKSVVMPDDNATEDDLKAYRKAMGIPETADGYKMPKEVDSGFADWFKTTAYDAGMTKKQAEKFLSSYLAEDARRADETQKSKEKRAEESTLALKKEWGEESDVRYALAKRAFKEFGDSEFRKFVKENNLESDARLIKTFYGIAQKTMGDRGTEGSLYHEAQPKTGLHYDI